MPLVGVMKFNEHAFKSKWIYRTFLQVIIHEFAHILAIGSDSFLNYKIYDPISQTYSEYPTPPTTTELNFRGRVYSGL